MNLSRLSFSYIRQRKLGTLLNVLLLALGIATIVVLLLFSRQLERNLAENAEGIDLVVGAKGSPLQLILSSIYHIDAPTGNIPVREAQQIEQNPMVRQAIPLALGDSYAGFRIVGTTHAYPDHYGAEPASGVLWEAPMEVTLGSEVARSHHLGLGNEIVSTHGLSEAGDAHGETALRVVGILSETGTVIDRLVLTSVETVWKIHGTPGPAAEANHVNDANDTGDADADSVAEVPSLPVFRSPGFPPGSGPLQGPEPEYTALLIQYSSPMAAVMFPRFVNTQTDLQAAAPAFETARLLSLLGVGIDALRAFGIILILAAALGVFIALYNALKERQYDLAIMRTLGASRSTLLAHVLLEGLILAAMGTALGLFLGHAAAAVLSSQFAQAQGLRLSGWSFVSAELWLVVLALAVGASAALLPAIQAYRTDIARVLARR